MKKRMLLTLGLLMAVGTAMAKPVDADAARRVAERLLGKAVAEATPADFSACHLFVGADGTGFALVAADDCVRPVLGYSRTERFPDGPLPHHIWTRLMAYQADIEALRQAGATPDARTRAEWALGGNLKYNTLRDTAVAPLLTTRWNQSPLYNALCPYSSTEDAHAVTGCVATATAQVMKYWNHPAMGRGSHSYTHSHFGPQAATFDTTRYDWTLMPDRLTSASSDAEIDAVALLMYHIGVAVEMDYSTSSSGAHVSAYGQADYASSENALKNHFRYSQSLYCAWRDEYSNAEWDALLTAELNASRPILFSGSDGQSGHAFVIDGYDSTGLFHVNWGWGGYCDGYYTFDNLSPTGSGIGGNPNNSYSYDNKILLNIFPASEDSIVTVSVATADSAMGTVSGGGTVAPYTGMTLTATAAEGYRFVAWKSGSHVNPIVLSPNNDYADTALFAPIAGDTLAYCHASYRGLWGEYAGTAPEWGIRIPAASVPGHRQMVAVEFYGVSNATYNVTVFMGNNFERQVYSANVATGAFGWYTMTLPDAVPLIDSLPLWIVLNCHSWSNPVAYAAYSGNADGSWYKRNGTTWDHLEGRGMYASWMIRAILSPMESVQVSAEASPMEGGSVEGGGAYYPGDTAVLTALPAAGYRFVAWSTGDFDNPLRHRVTGAINMVATFLPTAGVDDAEAQGAAVAIDGRVLTVLNPEGGDIGVFDVQGRCIATATGTTARFDLPSKGVYMVRAAGKATKVVAL